MTMRERMARNLCRSLNENPDGTQFVEKELRSRPDAACNWQFVLPEIDACLDALLEPTEAMLAIDKALAPFWDNSTVPPTLTSPLGAHTGASFETMIRAAKEGK